MNEFIDIPGLEGFYKINLLQQVRSLDRSFISKNGKQFTRKGKILKPIVDDDGYFRIHTSMNGKLKVIGVHQMMAITFIPNLDNKPHLNHKNGIKTDNSIENLEWCTAAENNRHAWATGLNKPLLKERHHLYGKKGPNAGKYGEELKQTKILVDTETGIFYYGAIEAAQAKNININNLRGMIAGFIKNRSGLIYA